jgi:hypothetical protein
VSETERFTRDIITGRSPYSWICRLPTGHTRQNRPFVLDGWTIFQTFLRRARINWHERKAHTKAVPKAETPKNRLGPIATVPYPISSPFSRRRLCQSLPYSRRTWPPSYGTSCPLSIPIGDRRFWYYYHIPASDSFVDVSGIVRPRIIFYLWSQSEMTTRGASIKWLFPYGIHVHGAKLGMQGGLLKLHPPRSGFARPQDSTRIMESNSSLSLSGSLGKRTSSQAWSLMRDTLGHNYHRCVAKRIFLIFKVACLVSEISYFEHCWIIRSTSNSPKMAAIIWSWRNTRGRPGWDSISSRGECSLDASQPNRLIRTFSQINTLIKTELTLIRFRPSLLLPVFLGYSGSASEFGVRPRRPPPRRT